MKKEIDIDRYNDFCDKIRSTILYAEFFRKKSEKRKKDIQELCELAQEDSMEMINRVKSLEELINNLYGELKNKNDS